MLFGRKERIMRLIDADEFLKRVDAEYLSDGFKSYVRTRVKKMPTIDAVPVIRCKDCKHREAENGFCEGRGWPMQLVPDDGFCDKGERKES